MDKKELEEKIKAWKAQALMLSLCSELNRDVPPDEIWTDRIDTGRPHGYLMDKPAVLNEVLDKSTCLRLCWEFLKLAFRRKGKSYLKLTGFIIEHRTDNGSEILHNH